MDVALELKEKDDAIDTLQISEQNKALQLRNIQIVITAIVLGIVTIVALFNLFFLRRKRRA